jgi:hypothetical protein
MIFFATSGSSMQAMSRVLESALGGFSHRPAAFS